MLGTGTSSNPYIIQTPADLDAIRNKMTGTTYYELGNDIDMSGFGNFTPIGGSASAQRFKGKIDGKGFKIKNLTINSTAQYTGFIVCIDSIGVISNIFFENANVKSTSSHVGVIVGFSVSSSTSKGSILNCLVTGNVTGTNMVSSIVGTNGGWTGNCYSFANIEATSENSNVFGIGRMDSSLYAFMDNCYFAGTLKGSNKFQVTGTSATMIANKYANNYYLDSILGDDVWSTPLSATQFKDSSNFPTFSTSIWGFGEMPYLLQFGEITKPVAIRKVTVNANTSLNLISNSCRAIRRITRTNTNEMLETSHRLNKQLKTRSYSYLEDLVSEVKLVNAKVRQYVTISSIARIDSSVQVYKRSKKMLENLVEPLRLSTSVLTSIKDIPVYANVYTLENQTYSYKSENQSVLFTNENKTVLFTNENKTEMWVK